MKTEINITIDNDMLYIEEENSTMCKYEISENWPTIIDNVCECLRDYLEGLG